MTKTVKVPIFPLSAWILMLVLGGWHQSVPKVPAPGYWLTLGSIISVTIVARALTKHEDEELATLKWRER